MGGRHCGEKPNLVAGKARELLVDARALVVAATRNSLRLSLPLNVEDP